MNVKKHASGDINTHGGGEIPPCTGLTPDALPEVQKPVLAENSQTGVSIRSALSESDDKPSEERKSALVIPMREGGKANDSTTPETIMLKPKEVSPLVCSPCYLRTRKEGIRLFGWKTRGGILSNNHDHQNC